MFFRLESQAFGENNSHSQDLNMQHTFKKQCETILAHPLLTEHPASSPHPFPCSNYFSPHLVTIATEREWTVVFEWIYSMSSEIKYLFLNTSVDLPVPHYFIVFYRKLFLVCEL